MKNEEEVYDQAAQRQRLQDLKRQVMRKVDGVTDPVLLESILELIQDAETDYMDAEKDPEIVAASENDRDHPENRSRPAPINRPAKNDADSWLDSLGR